MVVVNGTLLDQLSISGGQQRDAPFLSKTRFYCVGVRLDRGENEFVLTFVCRAGNQISEEAWLTLHYFNR